MEFKFRAEDHKPPCYQFPSSRQSYFSDHPLLRGFPSVTSLPNIGQMPTLNGGEEGILWLLEKEQIRREIISGVIARRRMLEDEVRRELMVERELALRRNLGESFLFDERLAVELNPRLNGIDNRPLEERTAFPNSREFNSLLTMPRSPQPMASEPAPENNKNKFIILAKPDPALYIAKRKAVTPPAVGNEPSPSDSKKKPKVDFRCALCQVSVTSETGLNEHLQGKKHKAKESALRMRKIGLDAKADEWSRDSCQAQSKVTREGINQTVVGEDQAEIKTKEEEGLVQKNQNTEDSKKQNGTETEQVGKSDAVDKKRKFKVWCEVCQVGSFSQIVMESHKKGKKHMNRLKKLCQNDGSAPLTSTVSSEATSLTKDTDTANLDLMTSSDSVVGEEH